MHPAIHVVVFDSIYDKVGNTHGELRFIHFRNDRAEAFHDKFDVFLFCQRPYQFQLCFDQLIDVDLTDIHLHSGAVHLHKSQQVGDDIILTV